MIGSAMSGDSNKFTTTRTGHLTNSSSLKRRLLTNQNQTVTQQPRSESSATASRSRDLIDVSARRDHTEYPESFIASQKKSQTRKNVTSSGASYEEGHEPRTMSRDGLNSLISRYLQADSIDSFPRQYNWGSSLIAHKKRLENGNTRDVSAKSTHTMTLNSPERKSHSAFCHSGTTGNNTNGLSSLIINRSNVNGSTPSLRRQTARNGIPDLEISDADNNYGTLMRWNFRRRDNIDRNLASAAPDSHAHLLRSMSVKASGNHSNGSKSGFIGNGQNSRTDDAQWATDRRHGSSGINDWRRSTTLTHRTDANDRRHLIPSNSCGNWNKAKRIPMFGSLDRHRTLNNHCLRNYYTPPTSEQALHTDAWSIATPNSTLRVRSSRSKTEKLRIAADTTRHFASNTEWKMQQLNPGDCIASTLSGTPNSRNGFHTWPRRMRSHDDEEVMWLVPIGPGIQVLEPESIVRRLQVSNKPSSYVPSVRLPRRWRLLGTTDCVTSPAPSCKNIEASVLKEIFMRKNTAYM